MYPLKSIIEFLLTGVSRIPIDEQPDALCSMFAGLLPDMSEDDINTARHHVVTRFWSYPDTADQVVDLIDGHLALRSLFPASARGETASWTEDTDYEV